MGEGADGGSADVGSQDGGLSTVRGDSAAVLSGIRLVFFYDLSAVYWLAVYPDDVRGGLGDVRVLAADSGGGGGRRCGAEWRLCLRRLFWRFRWLGTMRRWA